MAKIGIIGGSGLDDPDILENASEKEVKTPYGKINLTAGKIKGADVVLLARHGKEHKITPTNVNYRGNIHALKKEGCTHIIATTASGSLREEIKRGDLVIIDQFIDFTRHRPVTFFDEFPGGLDKAQHTSMEDPFDEGLRKILIKSCEELKFRHHKKGTVVTIEGARFSTRAESNMFRIWGADVINMSVAPEAILANEMNIPYAVIVMNTDYDAWKKGEEVTWEEIVRVFRANVEKVKQLLLNSIPKVK